MSPPPPTCNSQLTQGVAVLVLLHAWTFVGEFNANALKRDLYLILAISLITVFDMISACLTWVIADHNSVLYLVWFAARFLLIFFKKIHVEYHDELIQVKHYWVWKLFMVVFFACDAVLLNFAIVQNSPAGNPFDTPPKIVALVMACFSFVSWSACLLGTAARPWAIPVPKSTPNGVNVASVNASGVRKKLRNSDEDVNASRSHRSSSSKHHHHRHNNY